MRVVGIAHVARSPRFRIAEGCIGGMVQQDLCCAHAWNVVVTVRSVSLFACSAIEGFFSLLLFNEMHSCSSFVSITVHFKVVRVLFCAVAFDSMIATWLILPVVICLSQRLSHACLSINCFIL